MNLNEKVVLITGSARGVGYETAMEFAKNGAKVIINDYFNADLLKTTAQEIERETNHKVLWYKADVSKENQSQKMVDDIISKYGKIDILINNAAIVFDMPIDERKIETFNLTLTNNITSIFILSRMIGNIMKKNKFGRIINITSTNGIDTFYPHSIDYDASKAAVISLTKNFAIHFAPDINVNAIALGWVNTDMNKQLEKEFLKEECKKILLEKFAKPKEIAKAIVMLSNDFGNYITGEIIRIDGGFKIN